MPIASPPLKQSDDDGLDVLLFSDGPFAQLLRQLTPEFEGQYEPDVIRHCGWLRSPRNSQLCCRRRVEDAGRGARSTDQTAV